MPLAALLPVLGYTMLFCLCMGGRPEFALLCAVSAITIIVYAFALAGLLEPAAVVVFWVGAVLCVVLPLVFARRARSPLRDLLAPGVPLFVALSVAQWLLFHDAQYVFWDEFSHWGLAAKELVTFDRLWDGTGAVRAFAHYPPATAIWQYFVARNTGYSEAAVLFAQFLMLLAPTVVLYRHVRWKQPLWIAVLVALQSFLLANLGLGTANLYADPVLAVFLGGTLAAYLADEHPPRTLAWFAAPCACLALVKEIGMVFSLATVVWIAIDRAFVSGRDAWEERGWLRLLPVAALLVASLSAHGSWEWYKSRHGLDGGERRQAPSSGLVVRAFMDSATADQDTTIRRFRQVLMDQQVSRSRVSEEFNEFHYDLRAYNPGGFRLSALGFLLLSLAMVGARILLAERRRDTLAWTALGLALLFASYALLLLVLYLFRFPPDKAKALASYVRYMGTILLPITMVAFACYLPLGNRRFGWRTGRARLGLGVLAVSLVGLYVVETPYFDPLYRAKHDLPLRGHVARLAARVRGTVPPDARLEVISLFQDEGFMRVLLAYELSPIHTTFGTPEGVEDVRGQDYVWVFTLDDAALSPLGGALGSGARLFRVEPGRDRPILRTVW